MTNITELKNWRVFVTIAGSIHFAGYRLADNGPCVSPPIVFFDATCKTGVTRTGAEFYLFGRHAASQLDSLIAPYVVFDATLSHLLDLTEMYSKGVNARPVARPVRISAGLRATWCSDHVRQRSESSDRRSCGSSEGLRSRIDSQRSNLHDKAERTRRFPSRCSMQGRLRGIWEYRP